MVAFMARKPLPKPRSFTSEHVKRQRHSITGQLIKGPDQTDAIGIARGLAHVLTSCSGARVFMLHCFTVAALPGMIQVYATLLRQLAEASTYAA